LKPDAAAFLIAATSLPLTPAELITKMEVLLEDRFRNVQILPGILKLVLHLKKHGIPIAVRSHSYTHHRKI
jgi:pseudouridine-5'-monophosphatase